jgi:hypothetical protein
MTPAKKREQPIPEPRGFGEHSRGLSGEYAHEQGWGLAIEERTKVVPKPDGGSDYEYGARDFGDEPVNVASAQVTSLTEEGTKDEE